MSPILLVLFCDKISVPAIFNDREKSALWGRGSKGPFPILQACFGGHLGVVFCKFCNQKGFSEAYFSVFPAFMKRQNPFPLQKGGNRNGKGF